MMAEERGKLIRVFYGKKTSKLTSAAVYLLGMGLGFGMAIYTYSYGADWQVVSMPFLFGACFAYAAYRMATRHKRPRVAVYEDGLHVYGLGLIHAAKGFYSWDSIKKVEQERKQQNVSPVSSFFPGYYIYFEDDKQFRAAQNIGGYEALYGLLYKKGVRNSDKPLYLYNTDPRGVQIGNKFKYDRIYYPDKDEVVEQTGQPIIY